MADASLSRQFARWAAHLRYEDLPPEVVDKLKALLLHALAGAMFGYRKSKVRASVVHTLKEEGKPDGASIFADGGRCTRVAAAYVNAELIRDSQLVDSFRMLTHPGTVLIPVAMANAQLEGRSGRELITGLAAGYEFMLRLCDDFVPATAARGYRPCPVFCTLGGALAAGKIMGLDEDKLVAAIALAANFASGIAEGSLSGGNDASLHEPHAARTSAFAALAASQGHVHGSELALEGRAGFYNAFTGNNRGELSYSFDESQTQVDLAGLTRDLGREWKLLTVMFRMYPTPGYNQPVIDLIAELKRQHGFDADDVEELVVKMNWIEIFGPSPAFPRSSDPNKASTRTTHFLAAHAAVNGGFPVVGGETFGPTGAKIKEDQRVLDFLGSRVKLVPEKDRAMFSPAVVITLKDGRRLEGEYPHKRMEWNFDQLVVQLQRCLPGFPGGKPALDRLVDLARKADTLDSMAPLLAATLAAAE